MVSTRAENASKTPGVISKPRTRRTSEQVAAEKAEKKAKEAVAQAERDANVKRIADLKEQLRQEEAKITTPILERVTPKRKQRAAKVTQSAAAQDDERPAADSTDFEGSEGTGGASVPPESEEDPVDTDLGAHTVHADIEEEFGGDESGDYEPGSGESKDEGSGSESDGPHSGGAMDVDEDESELLGLSRPSRGTYKTQKLTKKEAGKALRDEIELSTVARGEGSVDVGGASNVERKRKNDDGDAVESTKKDAKKVRKEPSRQHAGGLKTDWRNIVGLRSSTAATPSIRNAPTIPVHQARSSTSSQIESSDDDGVRFGGFAEDDDGVAEREALKLKEIKTGSGGKGKAGVIVKRETSQMAVKIEPKVLHRGDGRGTVAANSKKPAGRASTGSVTTRYKNADLPLDHSGLQTWRSHFVPSFTTYAATFETGAWNLRSVSTLVDDVQKIWDAIFPDVPHQITWTGPVLGVALQRGGYEFHGLLKDAAVAAVETHWRSDPLYSTPEERAKYVKYALGPDEGQPATSGPKFRPLMWLDAEARKGTFRSEMVLRTFAVYLNISQKSIADFGPPIGALCVSTAAVERALRVWASGQKDAVEAKKDFSEGRWSNAALQYVSKARKLTESKWERLTTDAKVFTKATRVSDVPVDVADVEPEDACPLDEDDVSVSSASDPE
ncbi:hypothetical protein PLICRDRAFT_29641 [Plicaturopsis crispa FD-325 SS-3]|nr:hypothetical protein PLICRDRAFT_29641 [Plicaturopsis crispa FD-325 SS-3]